MTQRVKGRLSQPSIKDATTHSDRDLYLTNCTYCRLGIFKNHAYHWVCGDGLVHKDCNNPKG